MWLNQSMSGCLSLSNRKIMYSGYIPTEKTEQNGQTFSPYFPDAMECFPVNPLVNKTGYDDARCIEKAWIEDTLIDG